MCLAVPGKILSVQEGTGPVRHGLVQFGAATRDVCLAYVPEAVEGDYVIVHVGFAIARLDEAAAQRTLAAVVEAVERVDEQERQ